jgi:hypothetical protein
MVSMEILLLEADRDLVFDSIFNKLSHICHPFFKTKGFLLQFIYAGKSVISQPVADLLSVLSDLQDLFSCTLPLVTFNLNLPLQLLKLIHSGSAVDLVIDVVDLLLNLLQPLVQGLFHLLGISGGFGAVLRGFCDLLSLICKASHGFPMATGLDVLYFPVKICE